MSTVIFKDAIVELATQEDTFLKDIVHLLLEIRLGNEVVNEANLLSRESSPGTWDADQPLFLYETPDDFMVSISMGINDDERQLIASIEINGPELFAMLEEPFDLEIPLICHENYPSLTFKARALATTIERIREILSQRNQGRLPSHTANTLQTLNDNGIAALRDFEIAGNLEGLEQGISQLQSASEICPQDHPGLPSILTNLAAGLFRRFERLGNVADINEAIARQQVAVDLTLDGDSDKSGRLSNLGTSLGVRFMRLGNAEDLDNALIQQRAAVDLTSDDDPHKPSYMSNLANFLETRFEHFGDQADIDNAIAQQQAAANLTPDNSPEKHMCLNNIGSHLRTRFERFGNFADIDNGIAQCQKAIRLLPEGHPNKALYLNNLANSLHYRFSRLENPKDIDDAISELWKVATLLPDGHPQKHTSLTNLGNSLMVRFEHFGDLKDLDNAIMQHQKAVDLIPDDHPHKAKYLAHLGNSLEVRFARFGSATDINNAISRHTAAVNLTPDSHPDKAGCVNNLGKALARRFLQFGSTEDIDKAILQLQKSVELTPDGNHRKCFRLGNLGNCLWNRFEQSYHRKDAEDAILYLSTATKSQIGPPTTRFEAAEQWIRIASVIKHDSLLDAYDCALAIMPLVAWLGLPVPDRHQHLIKIGGIVRQAAAAAISLDQHTKALEWLEQGRSVFWTQILQLRTPVDRLREVNPELADRLLQVSRRLDRGSEKVGFSAGNSQSTEEDGRRYRALTAEWETIIEQVRSIDTFEDFLRPPRISRLLGAAQNGPVVVLNIAVERCDALAVIDGMDEVIHIPLPNITSKRVIELRDELKSLLYSSGIRLRCERAAKKFTDEDELDDDVCKRVLAELWDNLVKPIIDSLAFSPRPDVLPRIWWCATGPLASLPIHAAGIYESKLVDNLASDYVISSYTPTISALLDPPSPPSDSSFKLLSVIEPSAPGASYIPNTKLELDHICRRFSHKELLVLQGHDAAKGMVTRGMADCNWLHLACHGVQNAVEPTKSALLLHDGHLTLEEIIKLKLPKAEFAFLSACQTTAGDEQLSEEAVHIAGGMLLAGYRGVVATMWSIQDELAPEVTDEFYAHLLQEGDRPDSKKAAEALHISIQILRKKKNLPLTAWVPFVHLGV